MANHISLMLDSMFTAVEEGLSYDGIVSAPGRGLEDRPRFTVLLHDSVDLARMTRMAILRGTTRILHGPPQDRTELSLARSETVVQVSPRSVENIAQAHDVGHGVLPRLPSILPLEMDDQTHPTCQDTVKQQAQGLAESDGQRPGIQSDEALLHVGGRNLPAQTTVTQQVQPTIGPAEGDEEETGIQSNEAPLHVEDHNFPARREIVIQRIQPVIGPAEDEEEELGIRPNVAPLQMEMEDRDLPDRTGIPKGGARENDDDARLPPPKRSLAESIIIVVICTTVMVVNTSNLTSVSIALPEIGRALNIQQDQLQWLLSAYSLSVGCLHLLYGRLTDLYGPKMVFSSGMFWQAGFALGCGFSRNGTTLFVLRGLQGTGAAAAIPSALVMLARSFPPSRARTIAFTTFAAGAPVGAALGMVIGGVLTELSTEHWRSPFFFSASLSVSCLVGGLISFDRDRLSSIAIPVDLIGIVLVTSGLVLIVFALGQGPIAGWETPYIIACLIAGVILVGIFLLWERYLERTLYDLEGSMSVWRPPPLVKHSLWARCRGRMAAILAIIFLNWCGFICWLFWAQLYYQYYLGLSPIQTMVRFIPMFVAGIPCSICVSMLVGRLPLVVFVVSGALSTASACMLFALVDPSATYWAYSFPSTLFAATGAGFVHSAGAMLVPKIVFPYERSIAGRLFLAISQIGLAFGLAVSTIVFNTVVHQQSAELGIVVDATGSNVPASAGLQGYRAAQWTGAAFAFLAALLAAVFFRKVGIVGHRRYHAPEFDWTPSALHSGGEVVFTSMRSIQDSVLE